MNHAARDLAFWAAMQRLVYENNLILDRSKGSTHPRYPEIVYPLDYGYLENTSASDGGGIDLWLGGLGDKTLTGILCVFDTLKHEMEIKLLIACSREDILTVQQFHSDMVALYIPNPTVDP
jgi:inorganic pyrophosphatase